MDNGALVELRLALTNVADTTSDAKTADALRSLIERMPVATTDAGGHFQFKPLVASNRAQSFAGMTAAERARGVAVLRKRTTGTNFASRIPSNSNLLALAGGAKALAPPSPPPTEAIVIVDALSTGACVAWDAMSRGFAIVHVLSFEPSEAVLDMVPGHLKGCLKWAAELNADPAAPLEREAARIAAQLGALVAPALRIAAVVPGAETGVKLADHIAVACGARTNGTAGSEARRNKWDMGEKVRAAGVRAVMQLRADAWAPVETFLAEWKPSPFEVIVKPVESAGSDGVELCRDAPHARSVVEKLVGGVNGLGAVNAGVLVQEFLTGDEYVVDGVSRDGVHKIVALWKYDRRPTNGAGFVLHGQELLDDQAPEAAALIAYAQTVLDALEIAHGPSHMEVKMTPTGPCLVEVGARCHGLEGFWASVADEALGYNQATVALDSFVDGAAFAACPMTPPAPLRAGAKLKLLLLHRGGTLATAVNPAALAEIKGMVSYRAHEVFVAAGQTVAPTIDCFTWGGCVKLANADRDALDADYSRIEALCHEGLWEFADLSDTA